MCKVIEFPIKPKSHDSAINRLFASVSRISRALRTPVVTEMICGMFIMPPGDETGEHAKPCNRPTDFNCRHCGPICLVCRNTYGCSTPNSDHVLDPVGPEVA
jgi:hypothetical protein